MRKKRQVTAEQLSGMAERWNGESDEAPREPASEYTITIIVAADGAELKFRMPGISRDSIMTPGYERGIQIAVQNFEHFVYGQPFPPKLTPTVNSDSPDSQKGEGGAK